MREKPKISEQLYNRFKYFLESKDPEVLFLIRLVLLGKIELEDYYKYWGRKGNYKECCISCFVQLEKLNLMPARWLDCVYGNDVTVNYVRCPKCRSSSINKEYYWKFRKKYKDTIKTSSDPFNAFTFDILDYLGE